MSSSFASTSQQQIQVPILSMNTTTTTAKRKRSKSTTDHPAKKSKTAPADEGPYEMIVTCPDGDKMKAKTVLASQWYKQGQINKLAKEYGFTVTKGKFSTQEDAIIQKHIDKHLERMDCARETLFGYLYPTMAQRQGKETLDKLGLTNFWTIICYDLPGRPLVAVHTHVKRLLQTKEIWTASDDEALLAAYRKHGPSWAAIGTKLDRSDMNCRDRFRAALQHRVEDPTAETLPRRMWSQQDEQKLLDVAKTQQDQDARINWQTVAKDFEGRSAKRCADKWSQLQAANQTENGESTTPSPRRGWNKYKSYRLLKILKRAKVRSKEDIDWTALAQKTDFGASEAYLRKRFEHIERGMREADAAPLTLRELIKARLRQLKETGFSRPLVRAKPVPVLYKSKEFVEDSDEELADK